MSFICGIKRYCTIFTAYNSQKEKNRLQSIMAFGEEVEDSEKLPAIQLSEEDREEIDRFDEGKCMHCLPHMKCCPVPFISAKCICHRLLCLFTPLLIISLVSNIPCMLCTVLCCKCAYTPVCVQFYRKLKTESNFWPKWKPLVKEKSTKTLYTRKFHR